MQAIPVSVEQKSTAAITGERAGKYLVFHLGREEFGVRVLKVREIMGVQGIAAVPRTPAHVKGVINLRGKTIPVVDLRRKFGLPAVKDTHRTCIIVVQVQGKADSALLGIVVDSVAEVLNVAAGDINDLPEFGPGTDHLLGTAKIKGKVKLLLDIDRVLASDDAPGNLLPG